MARQSCPDVDDDHGALRRRRQRHRCDWQTQDAVAAYLLPHPPDDRVHRPGRRTSQPSRSDSPRTLDATDPMMPPPPPPHLARPSTDAYRRPRNCMAYQGRGEGSVNGRRRPCRNPSPVHHRRRPSAPDDTGYSLASGHGFPGGGSGGGGGADEDNDDEDDNHIEVVELVDDDSLPNCREDRRSSRDDYVKPSSDRQYYSRRGKSRFSHERPAAVRRRRSVSSGSSPGRGRRRQMPNVIETTRPPLSRRFVASGPPRTEIESDGEMRSRSRLPGRYRSGEALQYDRPRASSAVRPSRSRSGSVSGGPSNILGTIFGSPSPRRGTLPEERTREPRRSKRLECVICMGDVSVSKAAKLKCGHAMCLSCLERGFKLSLTDPQHMPPRCCTHESIPFRHVDRLFDDSFKQAWMRKYEEFTTGNRLYCPSARCGAWIRPANISRENGRKVARCSRCRSKVCGSCKAKWHGSGDCPVDEETANILVQAQEEGWKQCYRCKTMVELKEGCNHMTW